MKISYHWLQKYFDAALPSVVELSDAITFHAFEIDGVEEVGGDSVLDVKVLPDRTHDCLSYRGVAKEVSAIVNIPLLSDPFAKSPQLTPKTDAVTVAIQEPELCSRYIAGIITNVNVGPSPKWLVERLASMGQRSVNNVVDATNFVMFNLGQPLHAFDAGKLKEVDGTYAIEVRKAKEGETLLALDGKEYSLSESMLVIADAHVATPVGVAGVKGGEPAGISETTKNIIIESACFDGVSVRKTAKALGLRTDASVRFENVLSPELAGFGMASVVELIQKLAGGELVGFCDVYPKPQAAHTVSVSAADVERICGVSISQDEIKAILVRLFGADAISGEGVFVVHIPFERLDITSTEDLVADVIRLYGYDKIPSAPIDAGVKVSVNKRYYYMERVRAFLTERGFSEVITSTFTKEGERAVLNKVESDTPFLRASLVPGVSAALEKNVHVKDLLGLADVRLFEFGVAFKKTGERMMLALGVLGGKKSPKTEVVCAELLMHLGSSLSVKAGSVVEIDFEELVASLPDPETYESYPVLGDVRYTPFSRYPFALRDIALWTSAGTESASIEHTLRQEMGDLLVRVDLFDRFEKDGRVSYAFHLVFQSMERTLTDTEVETLMERGVKSLTDQGFEIR